MILIHTKRDWIIFFAVLALSCVIAYFLLSISE